MVSKLTLFFSFTEIDKTCYDCQEALDIFRIGTQWPYSIENNYYYYYTIHYHSKKHVTVFQLAAIVFQLETSLF